MDKDEPDVRMKPEIDPDWVPNQHGRCSGYVPEYLDENKEWTRIKTEWSAIGTGIPGPRWTGGVLETIGLFGYAQAQAFAWKFAAIQAAHGYEVEVRCQKYEVHWDIKARKVVDDALR